MPSITRPRPRGALRLALLFAISLGLSDLVKPESAVAATAGPKFSVSPAVAGEKVTATGKLPTQVARPVALQREDGTKWRTVDTGRTSAKGAYKLSLRAPSSDAVFRVFAKAVKVGGKRYPAVTTRSATLPVVETQTVTATGPTSAEVGDTDVFEVRVQPGRSGQKVRIERDTPGGWVPASERLSTSKSGRIDIDVTFEDAGLQTYRASVTGDPADGTLVSDEITVDIEEPAPARMTRISSGGGFHAALQVTDDGERVLWQRGANLQVWRRSTGASTSAGALPIANASVEDVTPDLRHVLLLNPAGSRLAVWDRETGDVTDVVNAVGDPNIVLYNGAQIADDGGTVVLEASNDLTDPGRPLTFNENVYLWSAASPSSLTVVRDNQPDPTSSVGSPSRRPTLSGDGQTVFFNAYGNETEIGAEIPEDPQVVRWSRAGGGSTPLLVPDTASIVEVGLVSTDGDELVLSTGFGRGVWRASGGLVEVPVPSGTDSQGLIVSDLTRDGAHLVFTEARFGPTGDDVSVLYRWTVGGAAPQLVSAGPNGEALFGAGGVLSDGAAHVAFSSPDDPVTGTVGAGAGEKVFYFDAQGD